MHYFPKIGLFKFILLFLLSILLSAVLIVPYTFMSAASGITASTEAIIVFLSSLGLYIGILIFIWRMSLTDTDRARIRRPAPARSPRHIAFALAPFLLSLPVNILYVLFLERFMPSFLDRMMEAGNLPENLLSASDPLSLILLFLAVVVMAPIVEEIAFRGVLYNMLNKTMSLWGAALVSSVVFGIMHGTTFLQTAVIGFVLAVIYQVTGDLKMAMLGHAVNNAFAFGQGILLSNGVIVDGETSAEIFGMILMVLGVGMIIATVLYLRRNSLRAIFRDSAPVFKHEIWENQRAAAAAASMEREGEDPDQEFLST